VTASCQISFAVDNRYGSAAIGISLDVYVIARIILGTVTGGAVVAVIMLAAFFVFRRVVPNRSAGSTGNKAGLLGRAGSSPNGVTRQPKAAPAV
jgi:hypothetical protein